VPTQYSQPYGIMCVFAFGEHGQKAKYTEPELCREAETYANVSLFEKHYGSKAQKILLNKGLLLNCKKLGVKAYRLNLKRGKDFVKALRDLPVHMRRATNSPNTQEREIYRNFRLSPSEGILSRSSDGGNRLVLQNQNNEDRVAPRKRRREAGSSPGSRPKKRRKNSKNSGPEIPRQLKPNVKPAYKRMNDEEVYSLVRSGRSRLECGFQTNEFRKRAYRLIESHPEYVGISSAAHPDDIKNVADDRNFEIRKLPPEVDDFREAWLRKLVNKYSQNRSRHYMDKTYSQLEQAMMMLSIHLETYHNIREIREKDGYRIGPKTTAVLKEVKHRHPCCRGFYASGFQAVIVAAYLTKAEFGNAWKRETLAFEADLICEENMTKFKGWNRLKDTGYIKKCQRNKIKNLITLTPEGEDLARRLIAYNKKMNPNADLNPIKAPDVYTAFVDRNNDDVIMQNVPDVHVNNPPPMSRSWWDNLDMGVKDRVVAFVTQSADFYGNVFSPQVKQDIKTKFLLTEEQVMQLPNIIYNESVPEKPPPEVRPKPVSPYRRQQNQGADMHAAREIREQPQIEYDADLQRVIALSTGVSNQNTIPEMSIATRQYFFRRVDRVMFADHLDQDCNLVLMVDNRERPGQSTQLRQRVCNHAKAGKMNYSVQRLHVADYMFVFAYKDVIVPIFKLYERKSAIDFAKSMEDGRLKKQIRQMLRIKKAVLEYAPSLKEFVQVNLIIEGNFEDNAIMSDGKRYVGKPKKSPTVEQCQEQLELLESWKDEIHVIKTGSMQQMTMELEKTYKALKARQSEIYKLYSELEDWKRDVLGFKQMKTLLGEEQYWPEAPVVLDFVVEKEEDPKVREYKQRLRDMDLPEASDEEAKNALLQFGTVQNAIRNYF